MFNVKKLKDNLYMCNSSYFTSMDEVNRYIERKLGVTSPKSDEEILEQMDIKVIEKFLRKKKLAQLDTK